MSDQPAAGSAKAALRARLLANRAARESGTTDHDRTAIGSAIAESAGAYLLRSTTPRLVAAYLSIGSEPPMAALLESLAARNVRLIVPVLLDDGDLDWASYLPGDPVGPGLRHTIAPVWQAGRLGVDALAAADLVVVPALAVDRAGHRLGRGGGSYDRALVRVRPGARVLAAIYDDELLDHVPTDSHDRRVGGALMPRGVAISTPDPPS